MPNLSNLAIVRLPCAQMPSALQKDFLSQEKKHSQIDKKYILQSRAFGTHLDQDCGYSQPRFDETVIWLLKEILIIEKDRTYLSNIWEVFLVGND